MQSAIENNPALIKRQLADHGWRQTPSVPISEDANRSHAYI